MAFDILTTTDFPAVRYLLGVDSATLPDAVIGSYPYLVWVETVVKEMADDWSDTTGFDEIKAAEGNDWTYLRVGTMHLLAARLVRYVSMEEAASVKIGDYAESGRTLAWTDRVKETVNDAAEAFSRISTRVWSRPSILIATGPTTSGEVVPEYLEEWQEKILPRILDWHQESGEDDDYYST